MDKFEKFDLVLDENIRIDTDPRKDPVHIHPGFVLLTWLLVQIELDVGEILLEVSELRVVEGILL